MPRKKTIKEITDYNIGLVYGAFVNLIETGMTFDEIVDYVRTQLARDAEYAATAEVS